MEQVSPEVRARITRAVNDARSSDESGRVMKVLFLDESGEPAGDWASTQMPEDTFKGKMAGLQAPPFPLEQLLFLAETHPTHSAAVEQKTVDVVGKGLNWVPVDEETADNDARDEISAWFEGLSPDECDMHEVIHSMWLDTETVGWGLAELVRDTQGKVRRVYHVPGHTVRSSTDGFRLAQVRGEKKVWFRRWGSPDVNNKRVEVDKRTGSMKSVRDPASDIIVVKKPSRRSTWYGIPGYVSSVGWITLALAARDDNILFFHNRREPRWAIILMNLEDDPNVEEDLRRAFTVDLKQPHRNLLIPVTGDGKIIFQRLSETRAEGSFDRLSERADRAIMVAHRIPPERLANSQVGPLGGNATVAASKIYKEGVVTPSQEVLANRLNRFIKIEYEKETGAAPTWMVEMDPLDLDTDREDVDLAATAFKSNLISLREARARINLGPLEARDEDGTSDSELNDMLYSQIPGVSSFDDEAAPQGGNLDDQLLMLDHDVRQLLSAERDAHERLVALTEKVLSEQDE